MNQFTWKANNSDREFLRSANMKNEANKHDCEKVRREIRNELSTQSDYF